MSTWYTRAPTATDGANDGLQAIFDRACADCHDGTAGAANPSYSIMDLTDGTTLNFTFDLTAKRIQTTFTTRRDSVGGNWRTIATADYKVTITNAGDAAVTVDVVEQRGGEWSVVTSSVKPVKLSSTRTSFPVAVPARGKAALTYRVRIIW